MDSQGTEERQALRKKRTFYLILGGVLSLLLPLLGVLYLKLSEPAAPSGNVAPDAVFARRDGSSLPIRPAATPAAAAPMPGAGPAPKTGLPSPASASESGLSMIRGGEDYYQPAPPAPAAPAPKPAPKPIPAPQPAPAQAAATGPAPFSFAHLKATSLGDVRSWFSGTPAQSSAKSAAPGQQAAQGAPPAPNINALMNAAPGAAGAGQTPDINALLKSYQQNAAGAGGSGQQQ